MFIAFGINLKMEKIKVHFRHIIIFYYYKGKKVKNAVKIRKKMCNI